MMLLLSHFSNANALETDSHSIPVSCNCVAFRLDDVQDYFLDQVQIRIIQTFSESNASLTIGIIGNHIGDDDVIVSFLKEKIRDDQSVNHNYSGVVVEVANHGWNHEDFTQFDKKTQSQLLKDSNKKILDTVGVRPIVFIPPFNMVNNDTIAASIENDIRYISSNTTSYPPSLSLQFFNASNASKGFRDHVIYHFPSSASTGDLNDDNTQWLGYSHQDTLKAIEVSLQQYGYAVVTMHPQEYSLRNGLAYTNIPDHEQILELELLLKNIHDAGINIVTISQIDESASIPEFMNYLLFMIIGVSFIVVLSASFVVKFKFHPIGNHE